MNWNQRYAGSIVPMGYTKGRDFICHRHITEGDLRHHGFQPSFKKHNPKDCFECSEEIEAQEKKQEAKNKSNS